MIVLLGIMAACVAVILYYAFTMEVLPRIRGAYYVTGVAGVQIGPFFRRKSAERYARGRGLASIDPALSPRNASVIRREAGAR